jgi:lipopolysaccharide export system protein LptA
VRRFFTTLLLLAASLPTLFSDSFSFSGDSLTADLARGRERTVLTGNARLESDDLLITATTIELYGEDFTLAVCRGGVLIEDMKNDATLTCDRLDYDREQKVIRLHGNAVMEDRKNEIVIKGEIMESRDEEGITLIQVRVRILREDLVSRSQMARYFREDNRLELSGMPIVEWKGDTYRATRIRVNLDEDTIQLEGDVEAEVGYTEEEEEQKEGQESDQESE